MDEIKDLKKYIKVLLKEAEASKRIFKRKKEKEKAFFKGDCWKK